MPPLALYLFRPMTWEKQNMWDVGIPLGCMFFFGGACAFPMFQLHGWLTGTVAWATAFLALCFLQAMLVSLFAGK